MGKSMKTIHLPNNNNIKDNVVVITRMSLLINILLVMISINTIESISFFKRIRKGITNNRRNPLKERKMPTPLVPPVIKKLLSRTRQQKQLPVEDTTTSKDVDDDDNTNNPLLLSYYLQQKQNTDTAKDNIKISATCSLTGHKGNGIEDQINQDRAFVLNPFITIGSSSSSSSINNNILMGVFDGHGEMGEIVSSLSMKLLPKLLTYKLPLLLGNSDTLENQYIVKQALLQSFLDIDDVILDIDSSITSSSLGGSSASIILQRGAHIYIANTGDSRSFIATYHKSEQNPIINIVYISREDKPNLPDEKSRIESMGGTVYINNNEDENDARVLFKQKNTNNTAGLAMSRSIGDWDAKIVGVIADPIVDVISLQDIITQTTNNKDEQQQTNVFAVSVTDGVLGFISPSDIARIIGQSLYNNGTNPLRIAEELVVSAALQWDDLYNNEYRDDISIALCDITLPY